MNFSAMLSAMKKINEEKEAEEAEKAKNKPFAQATTLNLNTEQNLAEKNRAKNREHLSSRAKARKAREIERATGYYDKLRQKDELKRQEMMNKKKHRKGKKEDKKNEQPKE